MDTSKIQNQDPNPNIHFSILLALARLHSIGTLFQIQRPTKKCYISWKCHVHQKVLHISKKQNECHLSTKKSYEFSKKNEFHLLKVFKETSITFIVGYKGPGQTIS